MAQNIGTELHKMAKQLAEIQRSMTVLLGDERLDTYEADNLVDSRDGVMSALEALGSIVDTSDLVNAFGELIQK